MTTTKSHAVKTTARKITPRERLVKAGRVKARATEALRVATAESRREIANHSERLVYAHSALRFALANNERLSDDTACAVRQAHEAQIAYDECRSDWQLRITEAQADYRWAMKDYEAAWEAVDQAEGR